MGFTWECDGNTFEEKGMIEDSLPEGFTYKIAKYKVIERSEIKEEIKFRADFSVSVSDKEEAIIFIEKIATLNGTELRKRTKEMRRRDFASQRYNCSRKLRKRKKNHEKQVGKDTDCVYTIPKKLSLFVYHPLPWYYCKRLLSHTGQE